MRDSVLLAVLVRAMVDTLIQDARVETRKAPWLDAELRAAHWRAARYGLSGPLVHPVEQTLSPASTVCDDMTEWLGEALEGNRAAHRGRRLSSEPGRGVARRQHQAPASSTARDGLGQDARPGTSPSRAVPRNSL